MTIQDTLLKEFTTSLATLNATQTLALRADLLNQSGSARDPSRPQKLVALATHLQTLSKPDDTGKVQRDATIAKYATKESNARSRIKQLENKDALYPLSPQDRDELNLEHKALRDALSASIGIQDPRLATELHHKERNADRIAQDQARTHAIENGE